MNQKLDLALRVFGWMGGWDLNFNPKSKIQNPKSKIQNPKSKIQE
jgi:hypothetical protein